MTKKITVSLPDDVAKRLGQEPNASAYVADAVRSRMAAEITRTRLRELGFEITEEGVARAREERERLTASITPELRARAAEIRAEIKSGRPRAR